jgi:hypothetical protein
MIFHEWVVKIMAHDWIQEENQYILDNYKTKSKKEFCEIFNVSLSAINHKYQRLGITEKSIMGQNYPWSDDDIEYLKKYWTEKTDREIWEDLNIERFGFGHYVVMRKRLQLGLVDKPRKVHQSKDGYKYWFDYDKMVFTHREKIEQQIGRKLTSKEIVHHIDGDKSNDDLDNLYLCQDNAEHQSLHDQLQKLSYELFKQGIIKFNKNTGNYYL